MRKQIVTLIIGILIGALAFGGTAVAAEAIGRWNQTRIEVNGGLEGYYSVYAYNIDGSNYFKLRDIAKIANFSVEWDEQTQTIHIDPNKGFIPDELKAQAQIVQPFGSGQMNATPIETKVLDGGNASREDFSRLANPNIFDKVFTRAAYNAIRQSIVDTEAILSGNNSSYFNPNYYYASATASEDTWFAMNYVVQRISDTPFFRLSVEPYAQLMYYYPHYFMVEVGKSSANDKVNQASQAFIDSLEGLTDREKAERISQLVCDRITYVAGEFGSLEKVFTTTGQTPGMCGLYANAAHHLFSKAGIPVVTVSGDNHAWNSVYIGGQWWWYDGTSCDTGSGATTSMVLRTTIRTTDEHPQHTRFAQELLVPGSTK